MSQLSTNVFVYPLDNYRFGRHKARKEDKDRRLEVGRETYFTCNHLSFLSLSRSLGMNCKE